MAIIDERGATGNGQRHLLILMPILPGKSEAWRRFTQELLGTRHSEHRAACRRLGIDKECIWLVPMRSGDWALLAVDMAQATQMPPQPYSPGSPFERWLAEQLRSLHGFDLAQLTASPRAELIVTWESETEVGQRR